MADALSEIRVALGLAGVKAQSATEMLTAALNALVDEYCEYMRINNLGDPEKQHNIKFARAALSLAEGH